MTAQDPQAEAVEIEELDVEEFAKKHDGARKPRARAYIIRVDRQTVRTHEPKLTGAQILVLVDKTPASHKLFQKLRGEEPKVVAPDEVVDLRAPGVERFQTIPMDTTEGSDRLRRDFELPEADVKYLEMLALPWEAVREGKTSWVLIHGYPVPAGYNSERTSAALEIPASYADAQIDMVYFLPHLSRIDGTQIRQLAERVIVGERWQRWSRHRTAANPWRPGYDCIETHLLLVDEWLMREIRRAA